MTNNHANTTIISFYQNLIQDWTLPLFLADGNRATAARLDRDDWISNGGSNIGDTSWPAWNTPVCSPNGWNKSCRRCVRINDSDGAGWTLWNVWNNPDTGGLIRHSSIDELFEHATCESVDNNASTNDLCPYNWHDSIVTLVFINN